MRYYPMGLMLANGYQAFGKPQPDADLWRVRQMARSINCALEYVTEFRLPNEQWQFYLKPETPQDLPPYEDSPLLGKID